MDDYDKFLIEDYYDENREQREVQEDVDLEQEFILMGGFEDE